MVGKAWGGWCQSRNAAHWALRVLTASPVGEALLLLVTYLEYTVYGTEVVKVKGGIEDISVDTRTDTVVLVACGSVEVT